MNGQTDNKQDGKGKIFYKCSVCGVLHDGTNGAPTSCMKCDNDKFFKVGK